MAYQHLVDILVITDGRRDCIRQTISSAAAKLSGNIDRLWIYDDSGDPDNLEWLGEVWPHATVFQHDDGRQGFGGAVRHAWSVIREFSEASHIFHLEDDFTFNRVVNLPDMAFVLDEQPALAQLALRRQPWNTVEQIAGGVVEAQPDEFYESFMLAPDGRALTWLEHRLFWTTNPSLIRYDFIVDHEWPDVKANSEGIFTHQVREEQQFWFGYWGARDSGEWVRHIGEKRVGTGY